MSWRLFHHKMRCDNPFMTMRVCFAAVCFLLAVSGVSLSTQAWGADAAPVVVRADSKEPAKVTEAAFLAHRILARESKELLFDEKRRRELAHEIKGVLKRLRYAYPEVAKISARAIYQPGVLFLGVKPDLFQAVDGLLEGKSGPVALRTGNAAFDALNARLELRAVRPYRHTGVLVMRFGGRLNVHAARRAYEKIAGIEYVEPAVYSGDGSDIEAAQSGEIWRIVVRKAWGDCLAGCIYKKLFFFVVKDEDVERIEPPKAMEMSEFEKILETRKWR